MAPDRRHRPLDPGERERIVPLLRVQERARRIGVADTAPDEHLGQDMADPELALERERERELVRRQLDSGLRRREQREF
jgi:hypothetical protein